MMGENDVLDAAGMQCHPTGRLLANVHGGRTGKVEDDLVASLRHSPMKLRGDGIRQFVALRGLVARPASSWQKRKSRFVVMRVND